MITRIKPRQEKLKEESVYCGPQTQAIIHQGIEITEARTSGLICIASTAQRQSGNACTEVIFFLLYSSNSKPGKDATIVDGYFHFFLSLPN